ncbi:MAG: adenine phosphoribosyltransferase [Atopococcus tabaci]|uniref:Adenine phosphoribosyltransferase n=1 Tax=Atopococcus tabaci TaxID=269774 RepID=A0AA43UBJ2_9LACT|nr:adenine phosphoribosyltransferase [Atopococcus tabaci]
MDLSNYIETIENYPEDGISFRDITPLMADGEAYRAAINQIVDYAEGKKVDVVCGPEARGFIVGCPVAYELGVGFVPARKKDKLPRETVEASYGLEYGEDVIQIHQADIKEGQKVLIVDDLLATGGTVKATIELVNRLGGEVVGAAFLIELISLKGREKIQEYDIFSLMKYD